MAVNSNRGLIEIVAHGLGDLLPNVVFIGGAVAELYAPESMELLEVRQTDDIDCVVQLQNYTQLANLEDELRKRKFVNDQKLIIRWRYAGVIVDIMPIDAAILGFSNRWYAGGVKNSIHYQLTSTLSIRIFTLPYFLATKFAALFDRGMNDLRLSKDLEDIVFCFFYRADIAEEIKNAPADARKYLCESIARVLKEPIITEAIYAVLPGGEVNEENVKVVSERMLTSSV